MVTSCFSLTSDRVDASMSTADKSGVSPPTKKPKLLSEFVVGSNGVVGVSASTPTSESQNLAGSNSNSMEVTHRCVVYFLLGPSITF